MMDNNAPPLVGPGESDLSKMLALLDVVQKPGCYAFIFVTGDHSDNDADINKAEAEAMIQEAKGTMLVILVGKLKQHQQDYAEQFKAAWLTLTVNSALHAVGLTAAVSTALADKGIACNVLAGYYHDHLLVPYDRAQDAQAAI